ncbi:hypothetical protein [Gimesia sp.]|uniref:hypothetical protein n=1 Tax=Gimesia sp. TaxID=2024833 RepID=UPI003A927185
MPVEEIWNNVIDVTQFIVRAPINDLELEILSFPVGAGLWLSKPVGELKKSDDITKNRLLANSVLEACDNSQISLLKIVPENIGCDSPCYFVVFGLIPANNRTNPSIAIRLDLNVPDWSGIERRCGFSLPPEFVAFAENWPGLTIGSIEFPAFLLPSESWLDHKILLAYDEDSQTVNPPEIIQRLEQFLILQCDYWGIAKLLDHMGKVWEYDLSSMKLTNTEDTFEVWLEKELNRRLAHEIDGAGADSKKL